MKKTLLLTVIALGSSYSAMAQLSFQDSYNLTGHDYLGANFADFKNQSQHDQVTVGDIPVNGQQKAGSFSVLGNTWVQGNNNFSFTYNPAGFGSVAASVAGGTASYSEASALAGTINQIHIELSAKTGSTGGSKGVDDQINLANLEVTSLDGKTVYYRANSTLSAIKSDNNYELIDTTGLLANGFIVSGTLNLPNALSSYNSAQNDKLQINLGHDSVGFIAAAPGAPAPPMAACLAFAGVLLLQAIRRNKQAA